MAAYQSKYHVGIDAKGYILARNRNGQQYYQKKRAPSFVNKFGSGDSSYRDATFWQFWAQTNWRNGSKQLRLDDPGKFWKSSNVNINQLEEITLSRALTSIGQTAAGVKINAIEAWRNSQNWWNANYGYRQQITVTAPGASQLPSGYPIKVTIDTAALQTASKVRSDRKDWRIIYSNGSSLIDLTRDYIDSTHTFFALQAAISAGGSDGNYYVYYGYATESTDKQPTTEADWNAVYAMYGTTPDTNSKAVYHFREGTGTSVADDGPNANTGTLQNAPSWGTDGKFGRYVTFVKASSQRMELADLNLGSFTMEGWVYLNSLNVAFAGQAANGLGTSNFAFYADAGGKLIFNANNRVETNSGTTLLSLSTWYHIAVTNDGVNTKLYINGAQVGSVANAALEASGELYYVAAQKENPFLNFLDGRMQHFRFSDIARTSFPYAIATDPTVTYGTETTTQPPSSTFDAYAGCSDGILYKWDGITTWTPVFDTRRLTWFDDVTVKDADKVVGDTAGTETAQAQSFQLLAAAKIKGLEVYLKKAIGTPGNITVRIETNNAGVPSGTLADANLSATITAFTTSTYGWITVEFASASAAALAASTTYWIVLKIAAGPNDNNYTWGADGSSPTYSSGNMAASTDGGATWTAVATADALFRIKSEATQINDLLVSSVGGTQKMLIATGDISSQTNGDARLFTFEGSIYALEKTFATATESQITKLEEFNSKLYAGVGPRARVYEGTSPSAWTLSKDIDTPQNPGYVFALKEYNGKLYAGGGSPEFSPTKHYNGFWYAFDTTIWNSLYPFDFTEIRDFEFYDAFLFGMTYHGHIYVYDTATLNPLFNFKDDFAYRQSVLTAKLYDDKIYFALYPQEGTNDTNSSIWVFDRHGMSSAFTAAGITGYRCFAVVNNLLLIGTGDNGYIYKLDLDNYATQGYVQSSYFDANLPSIDKLYNRLVIQHDPLVSGESIVVYYKFKESDSWTTLGTANTVNATVSTLNFPSSIYSKKISLKIELNTTNQAVTPKVKEVVLQYVLYPIQKWLWSMRVLNKKSLQLLDKTTEARDVNTVRSDIEASQNAYKLATFVDIDGTSYNVLFSEIDQGSWVINQSDVNEDEIVITLLEA